MDTPKNNNLFSKKIYFFHEETDFRIQRKQEYRQWIRNTINQEGFSLKAINFIFCNDKYLHKINIEHLNHDTLTDIISFQLAKDPIVGDIFISYERVLENAKTRAEDITAELKRVIIHGVLHFCGYKDKTDEEKAHMRNLESKYIQEF